MPKNKVITNFTHNLKQLLISLDQLLNVFLSIFTGNKAWADETLSARAWRHYEDGSRKWPKVLIDAILFFDPDHCYQSYLSEKEQRHMPPGERD
ncbi:hypothetical protein [Sutterella wadsworthensis]|uniref:hypothetical protein n=1 Tax=Sutterella wadsworthensis TaxID=40545 RepID=UPI00241D3789|nr:hypothetical protein [Sutterella wadsworthensis]